MLWQLLQSVRKGLLYDSYTDVFDSCMIRLMSMAEKNFPSSKLRIGYSPMSSANALALNSSDSVSSVNLLLLANASLSDRPSFAW